MIRRLWHPIAAEPAVVVYAANALIAVETAFGARATPAQTAAVVTISTAVAAVITALATRPVQVPAITGAVATIAVAAGAFGLHLPAAQIGAVMPVLSLVLALVLRQAVTPAATLRRGEHERDPG